MLFLRVLASVHILRGVVASTTQAPLQREYSQQLASLLASKSKPTVDEINDLAKSLYLSPEYRHISRVERLNEVEFVDLVHSMDPFSDEGSRPMARNMRVAAGAERKVDDLEMIGISLPGDNPGVSAPKLAGITGAGVSKLAPSDATLKAVEYIVTTIDKLSHLMVVVNRIDAEIKAENYVELIKEFDAEFNPMLAQLANEAASRLFGSEATPARWKEVIWQLHLLVSNYVSEKEGLEDWAAFKPQVIATLAKLLDYAMVARTATASHAPPPAGTSSEDLQRQLQDEAMRTACVCLFKCLTRVCGRRADAKTTSVAITTTGNPAEYEGPTLVSKKAIELVFFIDATVASIKSIIAKIHTMDSSGPAGEEALKNLKLRIALQLTTLMKEAIANDSFERLYDSLKGKSTLVAASISGVVTSGGWESIKDSLTEMLASITYDLNACKPSGIL